MEGKREDKKGQQYPVECSDITMFEFVEGRDKIRWNYSIVKLFSCLLWLELFGWHLNMS